MSNVRLRTAIVGFGKMAQGYAADEAMARYYPYATHAQVLRDHPAFDWCAVVDPDKEARAAAARDWGICNAVAEAALLGSLAEQIEVAILATPPESRVDCIDALPNLRAVLLEKPIGIDLASGRAFLEACHQRGIVVQVNLWRRADARFRALAGGDLAELIGKVQTVVGLYGNGLKNNGTHMVDMARMLFGEIKSVQRIDGAPYVAGPIPDDMNAAFALTTSSGALITLLPIRFQHYRENGFSIWGENGRLDILNEGLTIRHCPKVPNRAMSGEYEVASDAPQDLSSTVGDALYRMYENLSDALQNRDELWSSGSSALITTKVVEAMECAPMDGRKTSVCLPVSSI
jgi:predicted dehydrogenase